MQTNHWGVWVNSDHPVGGVINNNDSHYLWALLDSCTVIDLRYVRGLAEYKRDRTGEFVEDYWRNHDDGAFHEDKDPLPTAEMIEEWEEEYSELDQVPGQLLIGSWINSPEGTDHWVPDSSGEYSAIVDLDSMTTQIVLSKWVTRGALCSPCYPGQVDLSTPGDYLGYDLPLDFYDEDDFEERNKPYDLRVTQYAITVSVVRVVKGAIQFDQVEEVYSAPGSSRDLMAIKGIAANVREYAALDITNVG